MKFLRINRVLLLLVTASIAEAVETPLGKVSFDVQTDLTGSKTSKGATTTTVKVAKGPWKLQVSEETEETEVSEIKIMPKVKHLNYTKTYRTYLPVKASVLYAAPSKKMPSIEGHGILINSELTPGLDFEYRPYAPKYLKPFLFKVGWGFDGKATKNKCRFGTRFKTKINLGNKLGSINIDGDVNLTKWTGYCINYCLDIEKKLEAGDLIFNLQLTDSFIFGDKPNKPEIALKGTWKTNFKGANLESSLILDLQYLRKRHFPTALEVKAKYKKITVNLDKNFTTDKWSAGINFGDQ